MTSFTSLDHELKCLFRLYKRAFDSVPVLCRIPSTTVRYMRKVASAGVRLHHCAILHVLRAGSAGCIARYQRFRTLRPVDNVIISQEVFSGKTATFSLKMSVCFHDTFILAQSAVAQRV